MTWRVREYETSNSPDPQDGRAEVSCPGFKRAESAESTTLTLPSTVLSALANPTVEESFHMSYTPDAVIRQSPTAGEGPKLPGGTHKAPCLELGPLWGNLLSGLDCLDCLAEKGIK